ncbi:MAG: hypothetical protein ABIG30_00545 [Candidatus Aenigmatarchaeota archaeon]
MKGFMRVLEAIIASVIILASLSFFFGYQVRQSGWLQSELKVEGQDALNVIERMGLMDNYMRTGSGVEEIENALKKMLSQRIDYSIEIQGAPPPVIRIACICTQSEYEDLRRRMYFEDDTGRFTLRGRSIRFAVDMLGSINDIATKYDTVLVLESGFDEQEKEKIKNLLDEGTSVMLFSDIDIIDDFLDDFLESVFGLSSADGSATSSSFYNADNADFVSAKVFYYFTDLAKISNKNHVFNKIVTDSVAVDSNTILYSSSTSGAKVNSYGSGRTVWLNYFSNDDDPDTEKANMLLKSLILWSADDSFELIPGPELTRTLPRTFFRTPYVVASMDVGDEEVFGFYKINLLMWYIFY